MWPDLLPGQIVTKAREFLGTPWHHDARVKGIGIDCSGLLVCTFQELGVPIEDIRGYGRDADNFDSMRDAIERYASLVPEGAAWLPGDILLFRARLMFNHCGFWTGDGMLHAYSSSSIMSVVEHPMDDSWSRRVAGVYRYRRLAV